MYKIGLAKIQNWEDRALTMRVDWILRLNDLKRVQIRDLPFFFWLCRYLEKTDPTRVHDSEYVGERSRTLQNTYQEHPYQFLRSKKNPRHRIATFR